MAYWLVMLALNAGLLADHYRGGSKTEWLLKPAAAITFIVAAWRWGALDTTWGTVLFVGLLLAAGGDVLLIPKDRRAFLGGLVSFLLGHVAYAVAFVVRGIDWLWVAGATVVLGVIAVPVLRWLWPNVEPPMQKPVAAYIVVITAMVAVAAGTFGARGNPWILLGAFGFYLSDLSVAKGRFIGQTFLNRAWGLPLYFFSQLILASTP